MLIKIADALDAFLFGYTKVETVTITVPAKVRILKPGERLGLVTNDFAPPQQ